jgi:hypothetical protein
MPTTMACQYYFAVFLDETTVNGISPSDWPLVGGAVFISAIVLS